MNQQIRLGAFTLLRPISEGGMGTIWQAHHRHTGLEVAIKVISTALGEDSIYRESFEREVRAIAKLQHPRIVQLYDYGLVDSAAEHASNGQLLRESPWLAMELATHASLAELGPVASWDTLSVILFDVLDALAHAHARGIVHRDLKPGNVLITRTSEGLHCKLTDFGISHIIDPNESTREVFASIAGTPRYMAPEQIEGRWRDYGAWTDLYALGCLTYELVSGRTPFAGESIMDIAYKHLADAPPPLTPKFEVPSGFHAWLDTLLAKDLWGRFRRAADAAWALHKFAPHRAAALELASEKTIALDPTVTLTTLKFDFDSPADQSAETSIELDTQRHHEVPRSSLRNPHPPIPSHWEGGELDQRGNLVGAGLGLYRLREPTFSGREAERTILWNLLRQALQQQTTQIAVIRGSAGLGKSSLVQWVQRRAHELGVASVMTAHHSPLGELSQGLPAMLATYLGTTGLSYERTYQRLFRNIGTEAPKGAEAVAHYYAAAIAQYLHPGEQSPKVPPFYLSSSSESHAVVRTLATTIADRRGLIMLLDDAHWSADTLEFAARMHELPHAILLILTVRSDLPDTTHLESELLRDLYASPNTTVIDLEPLPRAEYRRMLDRMLLLEPSLREEVIDRSGSSPLFAVELVNDWVRRRVLLTSPDGFRLDATEEVPRDLHALWNRRLDRVLAELDDPASAQTAIEVAAVLGTHVDTNVWRAACAVLDLGVAPGLVEKLTAAEMIERRELGWAFRHEMLRTSVAHRAEVAGRSQAQHLAIATLLADESSANALIRRAHHLTAAGDADAARDPLIRATSSLIEEGRVRIAASMNETLLRWIEELPDDHPDVERILKIRLAELRFTATASRVEAFIEEHLERATRNNWYTFRWAALRTRSSLDYDRGDIAQALDLSRQALHFATLAGDEEQIARSNEALGYIEANNGHPEAARKYYTTAYSIFLASNATVRVTHTLVGLARCSANDGDFATATRLVDEAVETANRLGLHGIYCEHLQNRGDLEMAQEKYAEAVQSFQESLEIAAMLHNDLLENFALVNLGLASIYTGDFHKAKVSLETALRYLVENQLTQAAYLAQTGLSLWLAAGRNAPDDWDAALADWHDQEDRYMLTELANHALRTSTVWLRHGDEKRARESLALARAFTLPRRTPLFEARFNAQEQTIRTHFSRPEEA